MAPIDLNVYSSMEGKGLLGGWFAKKYKKKEVCVMAVRQKEICNKAYKGCFKKVDGALKSRMGRREIILE